MFVLQKYGKTVSTDNVLHILSRDDLENGRRAAGSFSNYCRNQLHNLFGGIK
jgi:hypothetical protein